MRVAISIVFNAEKHLTEQFKNVELINKFDKWIFVEGASSSIMCTSWCKAMPEEYHKDGASVDNTRTIILDNIKKHPNIELITNHTFWPGKVEMFNEALADLDSDCQLWEIDIDEYWKANQILDSEKILQNTGGDCASFHCDYMLADNIIVKGDWGESRTHGYRRLWNYKAGAKFTSHEPPVLEKVMFMVGPDYMPRFKHLSYYYESDVIFKSKWYGNHQNIYEGWKDIVTGVTKLPCNVTSLFRSTVPTDWKNTIITYA